MCPRVNNTCSITTINPRAAVGGTLIMAGFGLILCGVLEQKLFLKKPLVTVGCLLLVFGAVFILSIYFNNAKTDIPTVEQLAAETDEMKIKQKIIFFLEKPDVISLGKVSKEWRRAANPVIEGMGAPKFL